jgi:hypothetical protein
LLVLLLVVYWGFATFGALAAWASVVIACGEKWCDDGALQYDVAVGLAIASIVCASLLVAKRNARPGLTIGLFVGQVAMLALVGQILESSAGVRVSPELAMLVAAGHVPGFIAIALLVRRQRLTRPAQGEG